MKGIHPRSIASEMATRKPTLDALSFGSSAKKEGMALRSRFTRLALALLFCAGVWAGTSSSARALDGISLGGHVGINLDRADFHIGFDIVIPVVDLSPMVQWAVWPSIAHVFVRHGHDVELFGVDGPFVFNLRSVPITPFVGPGFGLAVYDQVSLKFNVVGGLFVETHSPVRPFAEMALRFIDGTFVDALFGVVVEL
jgi:hypothetical protein